MDKALMDGQGRQLTAALRTPLGHPYEVSFTHCGQAVVETGGKYEDFGAEP